MSSLLKDSDLGSDDIGEHGPGNILSRRLNKILETRLENDKDTLEALKELSTFFTENTLQARRNLRSKIEKRSLVINEVSLFLGISPLGAIIWPIGINLYWRNSFLPT